MTDKPDPAKSFLQALLKALGAKPNGMDFSVEGFAVGPDGKLQPINLSSEKSVDDLIHSKVDMDLIHALNHWFASQHVTERTVFSSLAYLLAHELYNTCESEQQACVVTQDYGSYMHTIVHALYSQHGAPKKSD